MVGVDLAALEAVRRAAGLPLPPPDEPVLGDLDLMGATALHHFVEAGLPLDSLVEASRVFGEAAAHAAAAAGTLANTVIPQPGDTELAYAQRLGAATRELTPYAAGLLGVLYRLHNRENLRNEIVAAEEIAAGRRRDVHDVAIALLRPGRLHAAGGGRAGGRPRRDRDAAGGARRGGRAAAGAAGEDDRRRRHARLRRHGRAARRRVRPDGGRRGRGRGLPRRARRGVLRAGAAALGRLLRQRGQPGGAARRAGAAVGGAGRRRASATCWATTSASPGPTRAPSASRASRSPCRSCACG